jgi:hypothetical protein
LTPRGSSTTLEACVVAARPGHSCPCSWPSPAVTADRPGSAGASDVCHDEAVSWVKRRLGEDTRILATRTDRSGIQHKQVTGWRVLVWIDRCAGYFTMGFGARTMPECTLPGAAERLPMLRMVGAVGDCRSLVPEMDFPE